MCELPHTSLVVQKMQRDQKTPWHWRLFACWDGTAGAGGEGSGDHGFDLAVCAGHFTGCQGVPTPASIAPSPSAKPLKCRGARALVRAIHSSIASSSLTTVNSNAALSGSGTVGSTVINARGFLVPGPVGVPGIHLASTKFGPIPDSHFGHESQQCYWPSSRNFLRRREPHQ